MTYNTYNNEIANKIAARLGLVVTGFWSLSFLIVVLNFPSLLSDLGYMMGLLSIFIVGKNLRQIRKLVMPVSWLQGWMLCIMAFTGGALITTLVQFVYFAYFDHGHFMDAMQQTFLDPAMKEMMTSTGNQDLLNQMKELMDQMTQITPKELTMNLMTSNFTFAFLFSLVASLAGGKSCKNMDNQQ